MTPWDRLTHAAAAIEYADPGELFDPDWLAGVVASAGLYDDERSLYGPRWSDHTVSAATPGIMQHPEEFAEFLVFAGAYRPRTVLEYGCLFAFPSVLMAAYFGRLTPGVSVAAADNTRWLPDPLPEVIAESVEYRVPPPDDLRGESFDLVFVDADHDYTPARTDYERFKGARLLAFHDVADGDVRTECEGGGVYRLWSEVKDTRPHREFLRADGRPLMGIGVLV